jgi:hypothetical protein
MADTTPVPGLYQKFEVKRIHGEDKPGEQFFVLSPTHDPLARVALETYAAEASAAGLDELARDLWAALDRVERREPFYE